MPSDPGLDRRRERAAHPAVIAHLKAARRRLVPLVAEARGWDGAAGAAMLAAMRADRTGRSWGAASVQLQAARATLADCLALLVRVDLRLAEHERAARAWPGGAQRGAAGVQP